MTQPIFHADTDIGTLIYIIVVVIWVISSALSKSRKKKDRPPPKPRTGESTAAAELREFIEQMTGQKAEMEPEPVRAQPPPRQVKIKERERPRQRVNIAPPKPRFEPEPLTMNIEQVARELRDGAPSMAGSFSTTLSSRGSLFKMAGATLPNFRYALSSTRPRPAEPLLTREQMIKKSDLRRIVAGQIILGPPRAFDPYTGTSEITR